MTVRFRGKDESEYITRPFAQKARRLSGSGGLLFGGRGPGLERELALGRGVHAGARHRSPAGEAGCRRGWGTIRRVRFRIEHYRAVDVPGSALGYQFAPTGRVEEVDAHDEEDAAAMALTVAGY